MSTSDNSWLDPSFGDPSPEFPDYRTLYPFDFSIGTVTEDDMPSEVTITGMGFNKYLNFKLRRGIRGLQGLKGDKGDKGDSGPMGGWDAINELDGATDLNSIATVYRGFVRGLNSNANKPPVTTDFLLEVIQFNEATNNLSVFQKATVIGSDPSEWIRWKGSGAFTAWRRSDYPGVRVLNGGTDFNSVVDTAQNYVLASQTYSNAPESGVGGVLQTYYCASDAGFQIMRYFNSHVYTRQRLSGGYQAWVQTDASAAVSTAKAYTDTKLQKPQSGMKIVPIAVTNPVGTQTQTSTATGGAVRFVRQYAHMPKRFRIHVANYNYGYYFSTNYQNLNLDIRVGVGDENGGMSNSVQAASSLVLPGTVTAAGAQQGLADAKTPWITLDALEDGGFINISIAWTGPDTTIQKSTAKCWTNTDPTKVNDSTVSGWTLSPTYAPFDVWIEAEVPARVPVIAVVGDSISVGVGSSAISDKGWCHRAGRETGFIPVNFGMSGSTMDRWKLDTMTGWYRFPGVDLSVIDGVIEMLGTNDLISTTLTLADLQGIYSQLITTIKKIFPNRPIYNGELLPSNKAAAQEQIRRDFNDWVATMPYGERGIVRWAVAVSTGGLNEDMDPAYSSDNLHPNDAGVGIMSGILANRPIAPFTPTQAKLKSLLGGTSF